MSTLGMGRVEALWEAPSASIVRCMAAHLERNGKQINWGGDEFIDAMLEALDRRQKGPE
jgi:hypothetical protein